MSPEVADKLIEAATALEDVCQLWADEDQANFDTSATPIRQMFGGSFEEVALTLRHFVSESGQ